MANSKTSPTQPGRGIRKIIDLYHDLTVLLSKARKASATNGIEGMDRSEFIGMTEEEIEEELKEYALVSSDNVTWLTVFFFTAANSATPP